ncbi:ATP synthase subunit alpha [Striga asiatica]|uniref:ATP synthase subunit alpha n=1 Tax=Striga asiatica TaxID=4170 RepID=A0A5A7PZP1_STRAF|nr:ATP synthase subunit alpha [Striga asiatica]
MTDRLQELQRLSNFLLGGALHVLEKSCFVSSVIGPWSSVRKGPRTEKRGPLEEAEAEAEMGIPHVIASPIPKPVHDSPDSIGNHPSISPKPSEHPYPRPNPSQQAR